MILGGRSVTEKHEVTAIRKKIRPTMRFLCRVNFREQVRRAALRRYPVQPMLAAEKYDPIAIPGTATRSQSLRTEPVNGRPQLRP